MIRVGREMELILGVLFHLSCNIYFHEHIYNDLNVKTFFWLMITNV